MADPTLLNGQITDAVTQANLKVLGEAPAEALGTLYQTIAQAVGLSVQNAVSSQHQMTTLGIASTAQGINLLYSMDPVAAAVSAMELAEGNALAQTLTELQAAISTGQILSKSADATPGR